MLARGGVGSRFDSNREGGKPIEVAQGAFRWMLGGLVLGWALQSRFQAAVAIPLGLLTLGWIGSSTWLIEQQMEFLFSAGGLRPILPLIGVGLISLSLLSALSKSWAFVQDSCLRWGLLLIAAPVVISTAGVAVAEGEGREIESQLGETRLAVVKTGRRCNAVLVGLETR